jgi:hypothetical protein
MVLAVATDYRVSSSLDEIWHRWTIVDLMDIYDALELRGEAMAPPEVSAQQAFGPLAKGRR